MISALGQYNLYKNYNTEAISRIQKVNVEDLKPSTDAKESTETVSPVKKSENQDGSFRRKDVSLEEATVGLKQSGYFEAVGRDSSIESLDITKAISDLKKDETLQQYQYFVGNSAQTMGSEDGIVVQKSGL